MNKKPQDHLDDLYVIVLLRGGDDDGCSKQHWIDTELENCSDAQINRYAWKVGLAADETLTFCGKIAAKNANHFVCGIHHKKERSFETCRAIFLSENCRNCPPPPMTSKYPPKHANLEQTIKHYITSLSNFIDQLDHQALLDERKRQREKLQGAE